VQVTVLVMVTTFGFGVDVIVCEPVPDAEFVQNGGRPVTVSPTATAVPTSYV